MKKCDFERFSVDRAEEDFIVLQDDDGNSYPVHKSEFSFDVKRGDILYKDKGSFRLDLEKTKYEKDEIISLQQKLLNKKKTK